MQFSGGPTGEPAGPDDGEPRQQERLQHVLRRLGARPGVRLRIDLGAQLIQVFTSNCNSLFSLSVIIIFLSL